MNLAQVARLLSGFVLFFSLAQVVPLAAALLGLDENGAPGIEPIGGFVAGIVIGLIVALLLWFAGRRASSDFFRKEGLAVVGLAWLTAGALGAIPYQWSGALPGAADALFESISGLTTTGASVLSSGDNYLIEDLPESLLLWRSFTQWLGGMGIILVFVVLLPAMGVTGKNLLTSEQIGVPAENLRPRMQEQARALFRVYLVLTAAAILALWLLAGTGLFDAVCHSFTALATGGFSTKNGSVGDFDSLTAELILVVFMFLAGCSYAAMAATVRGRFRGPASILHSTEFRVYAWLTVALVLIVTLVLRFQGSGEHQSVGNCLRQALFNVVSIITSTGYATTNFQTWPIFAVLVLVFCMVVGGCAGSTAGGVKIVRLVVAFKLMTYTLRHFIRPKSVERIKLDRDVLPAAVISTILALILMWVASILLGAMVLALDSRLDFLAAFTASVSMMGCTGPSLCAVTETAPEQFAVVGQLDLGPTGGYGGLSGLTKVFMAFQMMLGRLEIMAPLVLLAPGLWRR